MVSEAISSFIFTQEKEIKILLGQLIWTANPAMALHSCPENSIILKGILKIEN